MENVRIVILLVRLVLEVGLMTVLVAELILKLSLEIKKNNLAFVIAKITLTRIKLEIV